ncbi:unnamed protein product, partial [Musa acuminata var. zebrina]
TIVNHRDPPASILRCAIEWLVKASDAASTFDLGRSSHLDPKTDRCQHWPAAAQNNQPTSTAVFQQFEVVDMEVLTN